MKSVMPKSTLVPFLGRASNSGNGIIVIWLFHLIGDVFGVDDAVLLVDDEDCSLQKPPLFQQHTV